MNKLIGCLFFASALFGANPVQIAHNSSASSSVTIDSTGANLIEAILACESCSSGTAVFDTGGGSQHNGLFTLAASYSNGAESVYMYYLLNPANVGANHQIDCSGCSFTSIYVSAYSGIASFDAQAGGASATASTSTSCTNELVLSGFKTSSASVPTVSGMTLLDARGTVSGSYGGGNAELIQTAAGAASATWTASTTPASIIATFKSTSSVCGGATSIRHRVTGGE